MKLFPYDPVAETALWQVMCVFSLLIFLTSVALTALTVRQRRYKRLWACVPLIVLSYFMEQSFDSHISGAIFADGVVRLMDRLFSLPDLLLVLICLLLAAAAVLLAVRVHDRKKNSITPMSVKEAMDSLPTGILYYAPAARVLLVNRAMQEFCRKATGGELTDGESFTRTLLEGALAPGCGRVIIDGRPLLLLPDGTAWKISEGDAMYEKHAVHMVLSSDVTDEYGRTVRLKKMQEQVEELGTRLQQVNREIVSLTAEREILNAKVRIHDEFGSNLLAIRQYLTCGGTEEKKTELAEALRSNVSFLKNGSSSVVRDEYELLVSLGERLGVSIIVEGELPQGEPNKSIMATAIHECLTNTLRHAHGNRLNVVLSEDAEHITAVLTNNGNAPEGEINERGGLASLRELTQQAGGSMTVTTRPSLSVEIRLPKGDYHGI